MSELLYNLMHPLPNAVMTVIMGILAVYWLFTFVLGVGLDDLDLGIDLDVDVPNPNVGDGDVSEPTVGDAGEEQEVAPERSTGFFIRFLQFMNIGRVPFMLIITTLKFIMWIGTLITTSIFNVVSWGLSSLLILIPILIVSIFFTKFATNPMIRFFKEIGYKGEEEIDFLGRSGKMLSTIQGDKFGTAEFIVEQNPIKLMVKSQDGAEIKYGEFVVIMDETDEKKHFLVLKEMSIRNFTNE